MAAGVRVSARSSPAFCPLVDLSETRDGIHVLIDVAGVVAGSLLVGVADGVLVIEGERARPELAGAGRVHLAEIPYGPFRVELPLPAHVVPDGARASYESGMLRVDLSKSSAT